MSVNSDASKCLDNFIEAVYAMYDAASILIEKYKLTPEEVMLAYRATVGMWHRDNEAIGEETDENYE